MPRLVLCRTVMNVVATLMRTATQDDEPGLERLAGQREQELVGEVGTEDVRMLGALDDRVGEPVLERVSPGFQSEMARSTLNSAKNSGSCARSGRHPASGLTPFSW